MAEVLVCSVTFKVFTGAVGLVLFCTLLVTVSESDKLLPYTVPFLFVAKGT
jgi:hypothetical protein